VGLWEEWRRAGLQNTQVLKHPTNDTWGRGPQATGGAGRRSGEAVSKNGYFGLKTGWQKGDM
jgi:hypothetical protein